MANYRYSPRLQKIFELKYEQGLSDKKIATQLKISPTTVQRLRKSQAFLDLQKDVNDVLLQKISVTQSKLLDFVNDVREEAQRSKDFDMKIKALRELKYFCNFTLELK